MFDDVSKTIKAILYDRITSPLFGTFILSWCGWNWRLLALFLTDSSMPVANKLRYLDSDLYPSNGVTFIYGLLLPLATTAFFIYIYPWFARMVYGYWREQQNELKRLQVEKDGEKSLTNDEAKEIRNQALLSELQYQDEREKREVRIKDLENLVKSLQVENSSVSNKKSAGEPVVSQKQARKSKSTQNYSSEVKNAMFSILKLTDEVTAGSNIEQSILISRISQGKELSKLGSTLVLHCLDNLSDGNYISISPGGYISVQPKGRAALINKNFEIEE